MSRVGHRDPQAIQRGLLAILPTDPKEALPMPRIIVRLRGFLHDEPNEQSVRRAAKSLALAGAIGILHPTHEERRYRYWRRAA